MPGNDSEKISFKFMFKCRQCHWRHHFWRKTVVCRLTSPTWWLCASISV